MVSCFTLVRPARLPTWKHGASVSPRSATASTRASYSTRSASRTRRAARTVHSSGSPGPAPTSDTRPTGAPLRTVLESAFFIQTIQSLQQLRAALFHRHAVLLPRLAYLVRRRHPLAQILRQPRVERLAHQAGQRRRAAAGGKRHRQTLAPHHAAEIRRGVRRIVHRV